MKQNYTAKAINTQGTTFNYFNTEAQYAEACMQEGDYSQEKLT